MTRHRLLEKLVEVLDEGARKSPTPVLELVDFDIKQRRKKLRVPKKLVDREKK